MYVSLELALKLAGAGQDICVPPACTVALAFFHYCPREEIGQPWLVRLGRHLVDLRLNCHTATGDMATWGIMFPPELSQLRHITLLVARGVPGSLCVARLLGGLPCGVQSLHLDYPNLSSEQAVVVVPASLRALRIRGVCERSACSWACCCPPSERAQDLCFGLHAGLERLQLVLWGAGVGLQCLDARAPAGLRDLNVQARAVDMNAHLAAEVGQRGRMLQRCDVLDSKWGEGPDTCVPQVQVVHIGRGPVQMEYRVSRERVRPWACTCGTCAECLGPEAFGGVADVWH